MRKALAVVFMMSAVLAGLTAVACLAAFPDAIDNAGREPEDVALLAFWFTVTVSLVALWSVGATRLLRDIRRGSRVVEYVAVGAMILLGGLIIVGGAASSVDRFMIAPGLFIVGSAVAYTWLVRGDRIPASPALRQPHPPSGRG